MWLDCWVGGCDRKFPPLVALWSDLSTAHQPLATTLCVSLLRSVALCVACYAILCRLHDGRAITLYVQMHVRALADVRTELVGGVRVERYSGTWVA
jgi:hypothetical protein